MSETIRTVRADEWDEFMRFIEYSYGLPRNFSKSYYPELYRPEEDALSCFLIVERDGKIVSHVGLFPLEVVCFRASITVGGIGGVGTLPEYRGKGYMSRLLDHAVDLMKERGWPLSVLWGDRQRYRSFGFDYAGIKYSLTITARSLDRIGVKASMVKEVSPEEASPVIERLNSLLPLRVKRKRQHLSLKKQGVRTWLSDEGYVLSSGWGGETIEILEVASGEGNEPGLIRGVMERCYKNSARVHVNGFDGDRLTRLLEVASGWSVAPEGQFRIIDLTKLLEPFQGLLSERAESLRDFELSIGLKFRDDVDAATISVRDRKVGIARGRKTDNYIEFDECDGVRLFLGGPSQGWRIAGQLMSLLPLPLQIPPIDHV